MNLLVSLFSIKQKNKRKVKTISTPAQIPHYYLKKLKFQVIPGWFSEQESQLLYSVVMLTDGPILEIGHFLGRSTANICQALQDIKGKRVFRSYDLGFTTPKEFEDFYNTMHKTIVSTPAEFINFAFKKNLTTSQAAKQYLQKLKLDKMVKLVSGNFITLDKKKYDLIFCDAVHEPNEIRFNLPHIIKHSNSRCVWAFHDMNQENIALILRNKSVKYLHMEGTLGIFLYQK